MAKKAKELANIKTLVIITSLILVLIAGFVLRKKDDVQIITENNNSYLKNSFIPETADTKVEESPKSDLPESYLIKDFPFASQAPLGNWDKLHDEACEEASIILIKKYLNQEALTNEVMDQEILQLVDWQMKRWGGHENLSAAKTLDLAKNFYNLGGKVYKNGNLDELKRQISQNHPAIIPTAGRLLGNPNFRSPGPLYHMVVAIGYTKNEIIVQDVGTRKGNLYHYNSQVFLNAWQDWSEDLGTTVNSKNFVILTN